METIFIQQVNHLKSIMNIKYQLNRMILTHEKLTIRLSCFCSTATVSVSIATSRLSAALCSIPFNEITAKQKRGEREKGK